VAAAWVVVVNSYIRGTFYPAAHEAETRTVVAGVLAVSWLGLVRMGRVPRRRLSSA
jgi:hypothetical protein